MALTRAEKERIGDSRLKIQSVTDSLNQVDPEEIPNYEEIQECLDDAEKSLKSALTAADAGKPKKRSSQDPRS